MIYRLKAPRIAESEVTAGVVSYLHLMAASGRVAFFIRVNGGGVKARSRWIWYYRLFLPGKKEQHEGFPDIHGLLTDGRPFYLELKGENTVITDEQREFIATVKSPRVIAGFVESVDDVVELFAEKGYDDVDVETAW